MKLARRTPLTPAAALQRATCPNCGRRVTLVETTLTDMVTPDDYSTLHREQALWYECDGGHNIYVTRGHAKARLTAPDLDELERLAREQEGSRER